MTIVDFIEGATTSAGGHTYVAGAGDVSRPFPELVHGARTTGAMLLATGLRRGDRVGLILPDAESFIRCFLGCLRAGLVAVPLYPPLAFGRLDAYVDTTTRLLRAAGARMVVTTAPLRRVLYSLVDSAQLDDILDADDLPRPLEDVPQAASFAASDVAFLQFTSGSTDAPRGVRVSHGNLVANATAMMVHTLKATEADQLVSWLPLYHDMGLIGFVIAPLITRSSTTFLSTVEFLRRPASWMETVSRVGGTITVAPNFAFALAVRKAEDPGKLKLSQLRYVGCGAEPVHAGTLERFAEHFRPAGLSPSSLAPGYGAAEATLAMSQTHPGLRPPVVDRIAREPYHTEGRALPADGEAGVEVVCCGVPVHGHRLRIVDGDGVDVPERTIGEIVFSGPSVAGGYWQNPEATARVFRDDGLHTGDLGYLADGALYVTGRKKDLIILNGRNYDPQTIERAALVEGVRPGNVVAFSRPAAETEELVIAAEVKGDASTHQGVRAAIERAVRGAVGVQVSDVTLLSPGALPKTSSGKLQRARTRAHYLEGALGRQGVRTIGAGSPVTALRHLTRSTWARLRRAVRAWASIKASDAHER